MYVKYCMWICQTLSLQEWLLPSCRYSLSPPLYIYIYSWLIYVPRQSFLHPVATLTPHSCLLLFPSQGGIRGVLWVRATFPAQSPLLDSATNTHTLSLYVIICMCELVNCFISASQQIPFSPHDQRLHVPVSWAVSLHCPWCTSSATYAHQILKCPECIWSNTTLIKIQQILINTYWGANHHWNVFGNIHKAKPFGPGSGIRFVTIVCNYKLQVQSEFKGC